MQISENYTSKICKNSLNGVPKNLQPHLLKTASYLLKIELYLHEIAELKNARRARAQLAYFNAKCLVISGFFSTFVR